MTARMRSVLCAFATVLAAQAGPPAVTAQGPPTGRGSQRPDSAAGPMFANPDPIGFLLERRDSLRLADSVVTQLVRINLRLFRQNAPLRMRLDSLMPDVDGGYASSMRDASPEERARLRERIGPIAAQMRENARVAKEAAYALLTEQQRAKADSMEQREMRRLPGMPGQGGRGRPPERAAPVPPLLPPRFSPG